MTQFEAHRKRGVVYNDDSDQQYVAFFNKNIADAEALSPYSNPTLEDTVLAESDDSFSNRTTRDVPLFTSV